MSLDQIDFLHSCNDADAVKASICSNLKHRIYTQCITSFLLRVLTLLNQNSQAARRALSCDAIISDVQLFPLRLNIHKSI